MEMLYYVESGIIMEMIHGHGRQVDITDCVYRLAKMMAHVKRLDGKMKTENG